MRSRSFVEGVSRSRRRSDTRTEKRFAFRWDLLTNFGGFLQEMLHPLNKTPRFVARSRIDLKVSRFFLAIRSEKVRQAQDDRLIVCFDIIVRFFGGSKAPPYGEY